MTTFTIGLVAYMAHLPNLLAGEGLNLSTLPAFSVSGGTAMLPLTPNPTYSCGGAGSQAAPSVGAAPRQSWRYSKKDLHTLYAKTCSKYDLKWSPSESEAFVKIVLKESGGDPKATTSRSSSAGLFGFLRGTRRAYRVTLSHPHEEQAYAFVLYCQRRYGSILGAYRHHRRNSWY